MYTIHYKNPNGPINKLQFADFHEAYRKAQQLEGATRYISTLSETGIATLCSWDKNNAFKIVNRVAYLTTLKYC